MAVHRARVGSWVGRAVALAVVAISLTCGGDDGGGGTGNATLSGTAYWSGPVRGANVVVFQLVDGQRTLELARTTTGDDGSWSVNHDGYEHVEIDITGGSYTETTGGEVTLDPNTTLRGVALDLQINEQRSGVTVSPWTHLAVTLGRARWLSGSKESTYGAGVSKAIERLTNHLGFDPTKTSVAPVSASAGSPTEQVKYGLSLAGLSQLARLIAQDQGATVQSVNTVEGTKILARDAGSAEALFDGNGSELLFVGASCPPPTGCSMEGPGCYASCAVHTNTLRSRLGSAVLAFLLTPENRTTLTRDDVAPWLEAVRTNVDTELFGTETTEPFDSIGPTITWQTPADAAAVAGSIAIEVTAADPVGVMSLQVMAETPTPMAVTDTDPAPDRFAATFSTVGLPEGPLTFTATATDTEDNVTTAPRMVVINNVVGGTVSGIVYKGRVGGATVRIYEFLNGARGAMRGQGTTQSDGSFTNVMISDGYTGPLLIEAGFGGTYPEESATATVTLDVNDRMRTVIPSYADGGALSNISVTPLTSFATTYFEYLQTSSQGGTTVPTRWSTARAAMETHFGVANIYDLTPLAPAEMTTFNAQARYGMILVGLSETARAASTLGGGDGGTFGSAMNAMRVFRVLDTDLADGCWDGRQGATQLYFGGTRAVSIRSVRRDLANAIVSYLNDGARNQTPYAGAADILSQLDTLSNAGGNTAAGSCTATSRLNPDAGTPFDQTRPTVTFLQMPAGMTPPAGFVRGTITVDASASDDLDMRPSLKFTSPMMTADGDGDETDSDSHHTFDTNLLSDGQLVVTLEARDDAGNVSEPALSTRTFTVDNTLPTINIGGIADGGFYQGAVAITFGQSDANPGTTTATVDGNNHLNGASVSSAGQHTLVVTATDLAGNVRTLTWSFTIDLDVPLVSFGATTPGPNALVRGTINISATATDTVDPVPVVSFTSPAGLVDTDGSASNASASGSIDTVPIGDVSLTVAARAIDDSGRVGTASRMYTIDNTAPRINVSGVDNNAWYQSSRTITFDQTEAHPGPLTVMLNGTPITSPHVVSAEGNYTLVANTTDLAGNPAAEVTITFHVDLSPPIVSFGGATPAPNAYVRQTITINATATDTLDPVPIVSFTAPAGLMDADGSMTNATATGSLNTMLLPDGFLRVSARAVDDSGWIGTLSRDFTIDNSPPVVSFTGFPFGDMVSGWSRARAPGNPQGDPVLVISGSLTDSTPTAVQLTVGTTGTFAATVVGSTWSYTPLTDLAQGQHLLTATATDSAGNVTVQTYTLKIDRSGPTLTSELSSVFDETFDSIDYVGNVPRHTHGGTAVTLGGSGTSCPTVPKHAYLLDTSPVGTETPMANPLAFNWRANDNAGVGTDAPTLTYSVTAPGGQVYGPFALAATVNNNDYNATSTLRRNGSQAIPALGVVDQTQEGVFTITFAASDRLGNQTTLAKCWTHRPIGAPVQATSSGAITVATEVLNFQALSGYRLENNSPISSLLNATHAGAGLMKIGLHNRTNDKVWWTFTPTITNPTYSKTWTAKHVVTGVSTISTSCRYDGADIFPPNSICTSTYTGTMSGETVAASPFTPTLTVRLFDLSGMTPVEIPPCPSCEPLEFELAPNTPYTAVIAIKHLQPLAFTGIASGYFEGNTLTVPTTRLPTADLTPTGDTFDRYCSDYTVTGPTSATCIQRTTVRGVRYASALGISGSNVNTAASSSAGATLTFKRTGTQVLGAPDLPTYSWSTTESPTP